MIYVYHELAMTKTALEVAYQSLIARKRLRPDKHQHALVTRLATLQQDLVRIYGDENDHEHNKNKKKNGIIRNSHISTYFPNPRGLYIYGSVGTGKSHLADLFTSTLPSHIPRQRLHFHEFLNSIHYRLHLARSSSPYKGDPLVQIGHEIVQHEARVLCFDEFQLTDIADAMILQRLFGAMWMAGGVLVSTSNRAPRDLYLNGLNREVVVPFLREVERWCEVWEMGGREDYRMAGEGGGDGNGEGEGDSGRIQTFFVNDEEGFTRKLEEEIAKVRRGGTGGDGDDGGDAKDPLELISLPVYGSRTLQVSALPSPSSPHQKSSTSYTLLTATFSQLCESPLSASDYHTLCTATSHLYLHGVRKFLTGEKDAVRRFITLIDVAYEKGTRVICSYGNDEKSDGEKSSLVESLREVFENIVPSAAASMGGEKEKEKERGIKMTVRAGGGASSSMMSTFIGETEWSATGLAEASLATGGAGETDVGFAVGRAISRLYEMGSVRYGVSE